MRVLKLCFLFFLTLPAFAERSDTLNCRSVKPAFDFDQRFYYMQHRWANVWGYREGIEINKKFKVGIGEYYMSENVTDLTLPKNINSDLPFVHNQQLYFGTAYFEPFIFKHEYLETSLVFETGYGRTVNNFKNSVTQSILDRYDKYFIPAGAGLSVNLKFPPLFGWRAVRWFGINFVTGYRTTLWQGDTVHNYSGYYWSISGAVFLDRIVDDMHRPAKNKKG